MITDIDIQNYKSIENLHLKLGRVNVFIGENGAGKSNILEALALMAAVAAGKLDNEFLSSRGVRVTKPEWMRAAFTQTNANQPISISGKFNGQKYTFKLQHDNSAYAKWVLQELNVNDGNAVTITQKNTADKFAAISMGAIVGNAFRPGLGTLIGALVGAAIADEPTISRTVGQVEDLHAYVHEFIIYSPENTSLRQFEKEGQITPLGINGEGLLKLLSFYNEKENSPELAQIKAALKLLGWFQDFHIDPSAEGNRLHIHDRFLHDAHPMLDHRSANEGFFFLLFYFALFISDLTPKFFAIDNIDASLNPKMCEKLMVELVKLAKQGNKQVVLTSHNPCILDGLNLDDDEQRLFVVSRDVDGQSQIRRIKKPRDTGHPVRLSELFLRGALGGLPKGF